MIYSICVRRQIEETSNNYFESTQSQTDTRTQNQNE